MDEVRAHEAVRPEPAKPEDLILHQRLRTADDPVAEPPGLWELLDRDGLRKERHELLGESPRARQDLREPLPPEDGMRRHHLDPFPPRLPDVRLIAQGAPQ